VRRIALALLIGAPGAFPAAAGPVVPFPPAPLALSVSAHTALLYGVARESAYTSDYKISELTWPLRPVLLAGTALDISGRGLRISLDFASAVGGRIGEVTDSDYLNGDGARTHYSEHDGYLERAVFFEMAVAWEPRISPIFSIRPSVMVRFMDLAWTARDGYLQYPPEIEPPYTPWSTDATKEETYGTVLLYGQRYWIPGLGLEAAITPSELLSIAVSVALSPFVNVRASDTHVQRGLVFRDEVHGSFFWEPRLRLWFTPIDGLRLALSLSYLSILGSRTGTPTVDDTWTGTTYLLPESETSDATISFFTAGLTLVLSL
jgi:outer membrane protease